MRKKRSLSHCRLVRIYIVQGICLALPGFRSVIRNGKYMIPTEDFNIIYSDQIHVLTDSNDYPYVRQEIEELFGG